ncbi:MAG: hypothetical protein DRN68_03100 [Thaumarchaeota archaeon]|nr:MAG: hypothetical protein DRN68_03100 [Nitrososphaerota archaeon]
MSLLEAWWPFAKTGSQRNESHHAGQTRDQMLEGSLLSSMVDARDVEMAEGLWTICQADAQEQAHRTLEAFKAK